MVVEIGPFYLVEFVSVRVSWMMGNQIQKCRIDKKILWVLGLTGEEA